MQNGKHQTVTDAIKAAPVDSQTVTTDGQPVIDGPITISPGDAVIIKGKPFAELDLFAVSFSLGLTSAGDLFGGLRCNTPQTVFYLSGHATQDKILKKVAMLNGAHDLSRFHPITNDQLPDAHRLQLEEAVKQQKIINGLKARNGQPTTIVFDSTASLFFSDAKNIDKQVLWQFIQALMQMKIVQIWICPETKSGNPLPESLFDIVFRVEPDRLAEKTSFTIKCERDGNIGHEKFTPVKMELDQDEDGKMCLVEKGQINDRLVAIMYATNGKTQAEIGAFLGKDQSTISHWLKKAQQDGLIERSGHTYHLTQKGRKALSPVMMN